MHVNEELQPRWLKGDILESDWLNARSEGIEQADSLAVDSSAGLELSQGQHGTILSTRESDPFIATLSGSSSPYSWTKYVPTAAGTLTATSLTGTTNAYEINSRASLGGQTVRLYPDGQGGYNFQAKECCGGGGCSAVATITVQCGGGGVSGASVSLTLGATTVSGTTGFTGNVNLTLNASGTWSGTVSKAGFNTQAFTLPFSCASTGAIVAIIPSTVTISGAVSGGACILPASISVSQSATVVGTTTANSSGNYSLSVPNDGTAYTVTASHSRYDSAIATFSLTGCLSTKTQNFTLTVSSGYRADGCTFTYDSNGCGCCPLPAPDTLYINHGGYTITITDNNPTPLTVSISALSGALYCSDPTCTTSTQSVTFWFRYAGGQMEVSWARCALGTTCALSTLPDVFSGADTWGPTDITTNKHITAACIGGTNNPFLRTFDGTVTTPLGSGATVTE